MNSPIKITIKEKLLNRAARLLCNSSFFRLCVYDKLQKKYLHEATDSLLCRDIDRTIEHISLVHSEPLLTHITDPHFLQKNKAQILSPLIEILHEQSLNELELAQLAHAANAVFHYSQEGEDILLLRLLGQKTDGFFVDVGAHHPMRFSNTYALYRRGWRGINIDAAPGSMELFAKWRSRDINIEAAVSDKITPMPFHIFKESALNTFDAALAGLYMNSGRERLEVREINPQPLARLLNENLPPNTLIDLMSIDVEGEEMGVLRSNDWKKYSPKYLVLELLDTPLPDLMNAPLVTFLREKGYAPISKLSQSLILRKQ